MLNYCPWRYAKCKTDQIDFFLSSHDGFSLKGPNQDTGSSEQQEQSVTLTQNLLHDTKRKQLNNHKEVEELRNKQAKNTEWPRNNQRTDWTQVKLMKTEHTITKKEKHRQRKEEKCPKKVTTKKQEANLNSLTLKLTSPQMVTIQDLGRSCF